MRLNTILTLAAKHLMTINKHNLYLHLEPLLETLSFKLLYEVNFPLLPACRIRLLLFYNDHFFTQMVTTGSQTSQTTSNSNQKPVTIFKVLSGNLSLKLLCDAIFPPPVNPTFLALQGPTFNKISSHGSQTFQITLTSN